MARISTYIKDTGLTDKDLLVGSNYVSGVAGQEVYETANFTLDAVKSYVGATGGNSGLLKEQTTVLTLSQLSMLNYGNILVFQEPYGANSAISVIQTTAYLQAGQTPFNLDGNASLVMGLVTAGLLSQSSGTILHYIDETFINSTQSGYLTVGSNKVGEITPVPLGSTLGIAFYTSNAVAPSITEGDGTLTLKVLYTLTDFS